MELDSVEVWMPRFRKLLLLPNNPIWFSQSFFHSLMNQSLGIAMLCGRTSMLQQNLKKLLETKALSSR